MRYTIPLYTIYEIEDMKNMSKLTFGLVIILVTFSCSLTGDENYDDVKRIRLGMTKQEVDGIMRNPPRYSEQARLNLVVDNEIIEFGYYEVHRYDYQPPVGSSGDISIFVNRTDSIVQYIDYGY